MESPSNALTNVHKIVGCLPLNSRAISNSSQEGIYSINWTIYIPKKSEIPDVLSADNDFGLLLEAEGALRQNGYVVFLDVTEEALWHFESPALRTKPLFGASESSQNAFAITKQFNLESMMDTQLYKQSLTGT